MRLALIADIHANIIALDLALSDLQKEKVDKIIFLGDYIIDGENSNSILEVVKQKSDITILGNREKYMLDYDKTKELYNNYKPIAYTYNSLTNENKEYIKSLKKDCILNFNNLNILFIHGDDFFDGKKLNYDKIINEYPSFDICIYGHTHVYKDETYKNKRFINPGSIGQPVDSNTYKYCILDMNNNKLTLKEFNVKDTIKELETSIKNSNYHKENPVWSNLILNTIKDGFDYVNEFIQFLNSNNIKNLNSDEFNKVYKEYLNNKKEG